MPPNTHEPNQWMCVCVYFSVFGVLLVFVFVCLCTCLCVCVFLCLCRLVCLYVYVLGIACACLCVPLVTWQNVPAGGGGEKH